MKAIRVHAFGGPEVLSLEDIAPRAPGPGEALVRLHAAGVNFIDVYQRTGLYPSPLPYGPGLEGAGVVEAVGDGVRDFAAGDRVAWTGVPGSYAEMNVVPAARLVRVPAGLDLKLAAAVMLQGMTAHYLSHATYPLKRGDTCLVHAAAGGVGLLLCQMARERGARAIGTVSTEEKERLAREAGAAEVIRYTERDFLAEVRRLTAGRGVDVVYDSVGATTWERSLAALAPRGLLALFGQASGKVPPVDPLALMKQGSVFMTRTNLADYTATREELLARAGEVLDAVVAGRLAVRIAHEVPLERVADAHRELEGRRTTGKVLLTI
jgi:NADPH2:quinone reductase